MDYSVTTATRDYTIWMPELRAGAAPLAQALTFY